MTHEPAFAISANVHHPRVKSVYRLPANHEGVRYLSINLGDPDGYSHVSLLVTDEQWRAIVRDTDREIVNTDIREAEEATRARVAEARDYADQRSHDAAWMTAAERDENADYAIRCPEFAAGCAETFEGEEKSALVTEHMFAAHPEAVAR